MKSNFLKVFIILELVIVDSYGETCKSGIKLDVLKKMTCYTRVVSSFSYKCNYSEFKSMLNQCSNTNGEINEYVDGRTPIIEIFHPFGLEYANPKLYKAVNLLISKGANPNSITRTGTGSYPGATPLHFLVCMRSNHGNPEPILEAMSSLIKNGANVNKKDKNGQTPLFYALGKSHLYSDGALKVVKLLIKNGASITIRDKYNNTAIHDYIDKDPLALNSKVLDYFFSDKNIDINIRGYQEKTPLHYATAISNIKIVKYLVANKANINAKDSKGRTPLQLIGHSSILLTKATDIAKLLIHCGANVNNLDKEGKSVLDYFYKIKTGGDDEMSRSKQKLIKYIKSIGGV
jgi:ankyrin repeat protein